jgi:predicted  nucleic acid-binding Zn-ribbon protein
MPALKRYLQDYFKLRSADRNAAVDESRVAAVAAAIDNALQSAESEHAGLSRRLEDVRSRAAIVVGNGDDEYLDREAVDNQHLNALETEMATGHARLEELAAMIAHFKFLRAALSTRFSDFSSPTRIREVSRATRSELISG